VRSVHGPQKRQEAGRRSQQDLERILFSNVNQIEAQRTAGDPFRVLKPCALDPRPFGGNLGEGRVARHEPDVPVADGQLDAARRLNRTGQSDEQHAAED
jgi:hypothetical protein